MGYDEAKVKEWSDDGESVFVAGGENESDSSVPYVQHSKITDVDDARKISETDNREIKTEEASFVSELPILKPEAELENPE